MFSQKYLVAYVLPNAVQLTGGPLTSVQSLEFSEASIRDQSVVSSDSFYTAVKQWAQANKTGSLPMIVIFSDRVLFSKDFVMNEKTQVESEVLNFFDVVPFESILTKVYPIDRGKRAVAMNKALYDTICQGFSLQGIQCKTAVPQFLLGEFASMSVLNESVAEYCVKNLDMLSKQSMLESHDYSPAQSVRQESVQPGEKKNSQLPMLLGVFGVLVVVLIIVIVLQYR